MTLLLAILQMVTLFAYLLVKNMVQAHLEIGQQKDHGCKALKLLLHKATRESIEVIFWEWVSYLFNSRMAKVLTHLV